jgi:hypothetical protein
MPQANMNISQSSIPTDKDGIVIINALGDVPGGRTLDVSGVASGTEVLKAGHIIIKVTATGVHKPLGVTAGAYDSLDSGEEYVGVLKASIPVDDPRAAIVTIGQINAAASPYPVTSTIKAGLPRIEFLY